MGSLGFGRSFNTLETGESHFAIDVMEQGQGVLGWFSGTPWLTRLLVHIPSALNPITKLLQYSDDCVMQRKATEQDGSDIISHLIQGEKFFDDAELDRLLLIGDSRLVIIAGSDTTSAALAYAFYYIAQDKSVVQKIRTELAESGIRNDDSFSVPALQSLHYMNGVINEALRLHPPVPGGVFRQTPPEGLQVGDRFIPGNVNLLTPHYSLHRCKYCLSGLHEPTNANACHLQLLRTSKCLMISCPNDGRLNPSLFSIRTRSFHSLLDLMAVLANISQ
jgi:hypothetical protein